MFQFVVRAETTNLAHDSLRKKFAKGLYRDFPYKVNDCRFRIKSWSTVEYTRYVPVRVPDRLLLPSLTILQSAVHLVRYASAEVRPRSVTCGNHVGHSVSAHLIQAGARSNPERLAIYSLLISS